MTIRAAAALALLLSLTAIGCGGGTASGPVQAAWSLDPGPPRAGEPTRIVIKLSDSGGRPVPGARLTIDAHMDHPGMAPVTGPTAESSPGVYEVPLTFSMDGDWTLVASGTLADGTQISRSLDVANVR